MTIKEINKKQRFKTFFKTSGDTNPLSFSNIFSILCRFSFLILLLECSLFILPAYAEFTFFKKAASYLSRQKLAQNILPFLSPSSQRVFPLSLLKKMANNEPFTPRQKKALFKALVAGGTLAGYRALVTQKEATSLPLLPQTFQRTKKAYSRKTQKPFIPDAIGKTYPLENSTGEEEMPFNDWKEQVLEQIVEEISDLKKKNERLSQENTQLHQALESTQDKIIEDLKKQIEFLKQQVLIHSKVNLANSECVDNLCKMLILSFLTNSHDTASTSPAQQDKLSAQIPLSQKSKTNEKDLPTA